MGTVKLSEIRSRLKTAIEAIAGEGLKESPLPFQAFGRTPNAIGNKSFAVGIISSTILLSEEITPTLMIGTILILFGLIIMTIFGRTPNEP